MVSLFLYPVFRERHLRRVDRGRCDGGRLLLSLGNLVKSFFDPTSSAALAGDVETLSLNFSATALAMAATVRSFVRASKKRRLWRFAFSGPRWPGLSKGGGV